MMVDNGSFTGQTEESGNKNMGDTIVIRSVQSTLKPEPETKSELKIDDKPDVKPTKPSVLQKAENNSVAKPEVKLHVKPEVIPKPEVNPKPEVIPKPEVSECEEFTDIAMIELTGTGKIAEPEKDEKNKKGSVLKRLAAKFSPQRKKDYQEPAVKMASQLTQPKESQQPTSNG